MGRPAGRAFNSGGASVSACDPKRVCSGACSAWVATEHTGGLVWPAARTPPAHRPHSRPNWERIACRLPSGPPRALPARGVRPPSARPPAPAQPHHPARDGYRLPARLCGVGGRSAGRAAADFCPDAGAGRVGRGAAGQRRRCGAHVSARAGGVKGAWCVAGFKGDGGWVGWVGWWWEGGPPPARAHPPPAPCRAARTSPARRPPSTHHPPTTLPHRLPQPPSPAVATADGTPGPAPAAVKKLRPTVAELKAMREKMDADMKQARGWGEGW